MDDDKWANLPKRDVPRIEMEARAALNAEPDWLDPYTTALVFVQALADPGKYAVALERITTPESRAAWGDFTDAAAGLDSIPDWGIGSVATRAVGDDRVAYVKILSGVKNSFEILADEFVMVAAAITLVWSAEKGMWLVHAIGETLRPEDVPHG